MLLIKFIAGKQDKFLISSLQAYADITLLTEIQSNFLLNGR